MKPRPAKRHSPARPRLRRDGIRRSWWNWPDATANTPQPATATTLRNQRDYVQLRRVVPANESGCQLPQAARCRPRSRPARSLELAWARFRYEHERASSISVRLPETGFKRRASRGNTLAFEEILHVPVVVEGRLTLDKLENAVHFFPRLTAHLLELHSYSRAGMNSRDRTLRVQRAIIDGEHQLQA